MTLYPIVSFNGILMKTPVLFFTLTKKPPMRIALFLLVVLAFSACGPTYQYLTVDSPGCQKIRNKLFKMENDTMQLTMTSAVMADNSPSPSS